jgi:predicted DNA-binding transcriptional regulator AlpA
VTVRALATILGLAERTVREKYRHSPEQLPPSIRVGAGWGIRFIGVDEWLRKQASSQRGGKTKSRIA